MKWYGFLVIFLASVLFCDLLYSVRMDFTTKNALIPETAEFPSGELPLMGRNTVLSAQTVPKQPAVLFFFASWCRPCVLELPAVVEASQRHDVPFIGVAVRDAPEKIEKLFEQLGNPYQMVALDKEMNWAKQLDADSLPVAFVLDGRGRIAARIKGFMTREFYMNTLLPYLRGLKNETPL